MLERKAKEMEFIVREKTVDDSTVSFEMTDPNGNEVGSATMKRRAAGDAWEFEMNAFGRRTRAFEDDGLRDATLVENKKASKTFPKYVVTTDGKKTGTAFVREPNYDFGEIQVVEISCVEGSAFRMRPSTLAKRNKTAFVTHDEFYGEETLGTLERSETETDATKARANVPGDAPLVATLLLLSKAFDRFAKRAPKSRRFFRRGGK